MVTEPSGIGDPVARAGTSAHTAAMEQTDFILGTREMLEPGAMRRATLLLTLCAVVGVPTTATAACRWSAKLHAKTHHPKADKHWPIRVTTSVNIRTSAYYAFVFRGQVVETKEINNKSDAPGKKRFHFRGSFRDPTIIWPRRSAGIPLTFRVVLHNKCGTKKLNYSVVVQK
jgi:hypothetical protein